MCWRYRLSLVALALALNVLLATNDDHRADGPAQGSQRPPCAYVRARWSIGQVGTGDVLAWGAMLGALAFLNTWDYPIYLVLFAGALAIARYRRVPGGSPGLATRSAWA